MQTIDENGVGYLIGKIKGALNALKVTMVEVVNPTSVTLKKSEHSYLKFTSAVSCSISLNTINAGVDEIVLEIDCVGVTPTITFPNTVKWVEAPTFSAGKHFEISIKYCDSKYYAVWNSWSIS